MPTSLTLAEHLAAIEEHGVRLAARASAAGADAPVPSCPDWDAHALVAHQAMVHRWAAANVRSEDPSTLPSDEDLRSRMPTLDELLGYFRDGVAALLDALRTAPADLDAMRFLDDAPAPREFWARRQCHETTIHRVDAQAATLGRLPCAGETGIDAEIALDGIDELLRGFFTRGRSRLFSGEEFTLAVAPSDASRRWRLRVAERLTVDAGDPDTAADAELTGMSSQLYLGLWNRGAEIEVNGRRDVLDRWRASQHVRWT